MAGFMGQRGGKTILMTKPAIHRPMPSQKGKIRLIMIKIQRDGHVMEGRFRVTRSTGCSKTTFVWILMTDNALVRLYALPVTEHFGRG